MATTWDNVEKTDVILSIPQVVKKNFNYEKISVYIGVVCISRVNNMSVVSVGNVGSALLAGLWNSRR
jgi:uncharacterized membrane protein